MSYRNEFGLASFLVKESHSTSPFRLEHVHCASIEADNWGERWYVVGTHNYYSESCFRALRDYCIMRGGSVLRFMRLGHIDEPRALESQIAFDPDIGSILKQHAMQLTFDEGRSHSYNCNYAANVFAQRCLNKVAAKKY